MKKSTVFSTLAWRACQVHLVDLVLDYSYRLYQADLYNVLIFVKNVKFWYLFTICLTRKYHTQNTTQTGITVKVLILFLLLIQKVLNQKQLHNPLVLREAIARGDLRWPVVLVVNARHQLFLTFQQFNRLYRGFRLVWYLGSNLGSDNFSR